MAVVTDLSQNTTWSFATVSYPRKSYSLLRESEPQGKPKELRVWDDGGSECSVVERIEVEPLATSPRAKAGRLPSGVSSRESLTNRLRRECR